MLKKLFLLLACLLCYTVFAQQNLSVPLTDPVYNILEYSQLRNYCGKLHNSRPYTLDLILDTLQTVLSHPEISLEEKAIVQDTIDRLKPPAPTQFAEGASFWRNTGTFLKTGTYRYENANENIPVSVEIGTTFEVYIASNFNDPSISNYDWLDVFLLGDIGNNFSYNINMGMGIMKLDFSSYRPYSFSPNWGGYLYYLDALASFAGRTEDLAAGIQLLPELGVSFWDNKLGINFSRIRHDWGTGNGNLMLSATAQPFVAMEMYLRPVDFISLSSMTGILEYVLNDSGDGIKPQTFQNAYTAFMGEIFFGDYAYAALLSSVVWPKRFELGYLIPGMIPFFYQNMIGDFDNMLMGISLGANIPGYANFYFNVFMDELNFDSEDFFHNDRNMYSYQAGVNIAIPNTSFITFNLQYTKLEPYMYTHPGTDVPWYEKKMLTNYVNHGENLGYNLPPNSDEIKIAADAMPFWFLQTDMFYSLVRHGVKTGKDLTPHPDPDKQGGGDGNSVNDNYSNRDGKKYFLMDGVYEWIHSLGINAKLDMRFVNDIPLTLNLGYTVVFTHHTIGVDNKTFKEINDSEYKNMWGNYLTLSIKIY